MNMVAETQMNEIGEDASGFRPLEDLCCEREGGGWEHISYLGY